MTEAWFENLETPVRGSYEVIVVGGGVAGVAAALAARRNGCSTLLVEKSVVLGGLATLGLVTIYLPLCDGRGHKVIGGIAEELLHASIRYGPDSLPDAWRDGPAVADTDKRYMTSFNAASFVLALDELIEEAGVDLLLDTVFSRPLMEGDTCRGIAVENKSGRSAYRAQVVVDATGDCDVMALAGAACVDGENVLSFWAESVDLARMARAAEAGNPGRAIASARWGAGIGREGEVFGYQFVDEAPGALRFHGISGEDVTRFVLEGRKLARKAVVESKGDTLLTALPGMAQYRTTRRIRGCRELTADDMFRRMDDSVGCINDWIRPGPVFEVPYGALIAPEVRNVIAAGRIIAAAGDVWGAARVIPPAALTGQAAGTAAALAAQGGTDLHALPVAALQENLAETGVIVHWERGA